MDAAYDLDYLRQERLELAITCNSATRACTEAPSPRYPSRLVEPVDAAYDLDNLRLEELGPGQRSMAAAFELEALMLTGSCIDLASMQARVREQVGRALGVLCCVRVISMVRP